MSKRKMVIPIEDQITDYFDSAPQHAVETLLRVINRQVARRFPPIVAQKTLTPTKVKGNDKVVKPALGQGIKDATPAKPAVLNFEGEQHGLKPVGKEATSE